MTLWRRFLDWAQAPSSPGRGTQRPVDAAAKGPIELPTEPYVFECQSCGKVFEARRKHPSCPECDSTAVSLMSE
ncbi:MAG: hypothetical protein HY270_04285 [Deltaproteobacteria bacterium]|nr:hypothetical protein [Deltaproteobacteria bacterium]